MLSNTVKLLSCRSQISSRCSARSIFWWGHDTEEDQAQRKLMDSRKGLIKWTDPKKDLAEKKEYVWAPARMEEEAAMTIGTTTGMMNHVDLLKWMDRKVIKANWHTWMTDPVRWREDMRKKHHQHLVMSQAVLEQIVIFQTIV